MEFEVEGVDAADKGRRAAPVGDVGLGAAQYQVADIDAWRRSVGLLFFLAGEGGQHPAPVERSLRVIAQDQAGGQAVELELVDHHAARADAGDRKVDEEFAKRQQRRTFRVS